MKSSTFSVPLLSGIPALIVEPEDADREFLVATMESAGLDVTAARNFSSARAVLLDQPPSLLVTEIRLGSYNGLQLALLGRSARRNMNLIVMSKVDDRVLRREAEAMEAAFVQKPTTSATLLAAVYRMVLREPNAEGTVGTRPLLEHRFKESCQMVATFGDEKERRHRKRRREIATFLFWEALRR